MKNAIYTSEKNWNRLIMIIFFKNNILKKTACIATFEIYFSCFFFFKLSNLFFLTFFYFLIECPFFKYCQIFD